MPIDHEGGVRKTARIGRNLVWSALLCGCIGLAGVAGYFWGNVRRGWPTTLSVQQQVPFEFYLTERSFSEIENTKARLDALCAQFLTELRVRHNASALGSAAAGFHGNPSYAVRPEGAIEELGKGIAQVRGTAQEMQLVRELLRLLKNHKLGDRWLDVYLSFLYEHPTDPLIGKCAQDALVISDALGRQNELAHAFDLLRRIPPQFHVAEQYLAPPSDTSLAALGPPTERVVVNPRSSETIQQVRR